MRALFWHFVKKRNSTARPNLATAVEKNVSIKRTGYGSNAQHKSYSSCMVTDPVLFLTNDTLGEPNLHGEMMNYCMLMGRYYFIADMDVGYEGTITLYLKIDFLATHKDNILNGTCKVLYSSSNYDIHQDDKRLVMSELNTHQSNVADFYPTGGTASTPKYIMSSVGGDPLGTSIVSPALAYGLSIADMQAVVQTLASEDLSQVTTVIQAILKFLLRPLDCIMGAYYTGNFDLSQYMGSGEPFYLGSFLTSATARPVNNTIVDSSFVIPIPKFTADFRNGKRFTSYILSIPGCGTYPIDADLVYNKTNLYIDSALSLIDGSVAGVIKTEGNTTLSKFTGTLFSKINIGQVVNPLIPILTQLTASAIPDIGARQATAMTMHGSGNEDGETKFNFVGNATRSSQIQLTTNVGNSILSGLTQAAAFTGTAGGSGVTPPINDTKIVLTGVHYQSAEEPSAISSVLGRPCNKTLPLSTLSGYVQTTGASIAIPDILDINKMVNAALDNGIYIE